jgi:hypothetical protein
VHFVAPFSSQRNSNSRGSILVLEFGASLELGAWSLELAVITASNPLSAAPVREHPQPLFQVFPTPVANDSSAFDQRDRYQRPPRKR